MRILKNVKNNKKKWHFFWICPGLFRAISIRQSVNWNYWSIEEIEWKKWMNTIWIVRKWRNTLFWLFFWKNKLFLLKQNILFFSRIWWRIFWTYFYPFGMFSKKNWIFCEFNFVLFINLCYISFEFIFPFMKKIHLNDVFWKTKSKFFHLLP